MSEHEVSRVVSASSADVFAVVSDVSRLPEWLPTVQVAEPSPADADTDVHVEGTVTPGSGGGDYSSDGFWRVSPDQLRVEWGKPSRGGEPETYAGWLQVEDRTSGCEVVVHLSFFADAAGHETAPPRVEDGLAASVDALAEIVEG